MLQKSPPSETVVSIDPNGDTLTTAGRTISLAWRNLSYEVPSTFNLPLLQKSSKTLLHNLNGSFAPSSLNFLMGPSGAGKTTLLNCLSGTITTGLTANSAIFTSHCGSPISYFIGQHAAEAIEGQLTVRQLLQYAFQFKNGLHKMSQMETHLCKTARELLLEEAQLLERPFAKCSGGEQKRIAIAQELMSLQKPDFLFADEITTGLDSISALEMVKCLASLAKRADNRLTVVVSIHSPSAELLHHFDKLYVLAKGGVCIYSGRPEGVSASLNKLLGVHVISEQPIEALIKIAGSGLTDSQVQTLANSVAMTEFTSLSSHLGTLNELPSGLAHISKRFNLADLYLETCRRCRITFLARYQLFLSQLLILTAIFTLLPTLFNPDRVIPTGCSPVGTPTSCTTTIWSHLLLNENTNYLQLNRTYQSYIILMTTGLLYTSLVQFCTTEHRNGWYSITVFYLATSISAFLEVALFSLTLSVVSYFAGSEHAIDLYNLNWSRLAHYTFCTLLCFSLMQSYGQLVGALASGSLEVVIVLASTLYTFLMLLDDYFFKVEHLRYSIFVYASELLGTKYATRYLLWIFYGLDRCDSATEYSWLLRQNATSGEDVPLYIGKLLVRTLILRVLTLLWLYAKFNWPNKRSLRTLVGLDNQPALIDWPEQLPSSSVDLNANLKAVELSFDQTSCSKNRICIAWRHLTLHGSRSLYFATKSDSSPPILHNLNGQLFFGTLAALMGISGAGKTSLLKLLNGRGHWRLSPSSRLYLSRHISIQTAYIAQEVSDHLMGGLTAKQLLLYASKLKNRTVEGVDHESIALKWLEELGLSDTANTKVEYCSGGERKRLALGVELTALQMPNLICIDEPTSGLDSHSAEIVLSTLRRLTRQHFITLIASIHQPNTAQLALFDQLYVLARGGICVYSAPPEAIISTFKQIPEIDSLDANSPIEQLLKFSCLPADSNPIVHRLVQMAADSIHQSDSHLQAETCLASADLLLNRARFSLHSVGLLTTRYFTYTRSYLLREWLPYTIFYLSYGIHLSLFFDPKIALPSGCLNLEDDFNATTCERESTNQQVINQQALLANLQYNVFLSNMFVMIVIMQTGLNLLKELPLFFNEHRNGWYSTGSFYLSKLLFEVLPILPLLCIYLYIVNIYEPVQPGIYLHLVLVIYLSLLATQGLSYIFLMLCNLQLLPSMVLGIGTYLLMLLLGNLYSSLKDLPIIYQYAAYLSIPRYTIEALLLLEYGFGRCSPQQIQPLLYWMDLVDEDYVGCLGMLLLQAVLYRCLALWMLVKKANGREVAAREVA